MIKLHLLCLFILTSFLSLYGRAQDLGDLKDPRNRNIKVSIVDEALVPKILEIMKNDPIISWTNLGGVCSARGARVCRELDQKLGIKCAKAYVDCCRGTGESCFFAQERPECLSYKSLTEKYIWKYHTAPVFLVKNIDGVISPMVFDLGISQEPMSVNLWKQKLNPKGTHQLYFGNRYSSIGYDQTTLYKEDYPNMIIDGEKDLRELKEQEN